MKNLLVKFRWDCGRQGRLTGLFVCTEAEREELIGKHVYFGEVLGKHSEIAGTIEEDELTILSDDQEKIDWLVGIMGNRHTIAGHNPLEYYREMEAR